MKKTFLSIALLCASFFVLSPVASAQQTAHIGIIVDASGSMNAQLDGKPRIDIAKASINEIFAGLNAEIALWVFGHNYSNALADKEKSCLDVERLTDFTTDLDQVKSLVNGLVAKSWTPLAYSMAMVGEYLTSVKDMLENKKMVLIVLSDGLDTCDGDPEAEARKLREMGIDVTIHVVGFAVDEETKAMLEKVALAGGGKYFGADNAGELTSSFEQIVEVEKFEGKEAQDVIETTGAENILEGGSTFADAKPFPREMLGKDFSLKEHLKKGAFETFTLDVKEGDILNINIVTGEHGIVEQEDGSMQQGGLPWSMINFYTSRKVEIDGVRTYAKPFTELDDTVYFDKDGTAIFFIGHDTSSSYGIPKDTIYNLQFKGAEEEKMMDEEEEEADDEEKEDKMDEESEKEAEEEAGTEKDVEVGGVVGDADDGKPMSEKVSVGGTVEDKGGFTMEQILYYFGIPGAVLLLILFFIFGRKKKKGGDYEMKPDDSPTPSAPEASAALEEKVEEETSVEEEKEEEIPVEVVKTQETEVEEEKEAPEEEKAEESGEEEKSEEVSSEGEEEKVEEAASETEEEKREKGGEEEKKAEGTEEEKKEGQE